VRLTRAEGLLDAEKLIGHHRQDGRRDSVDLVETTPTAAGGDALEEFPHRRRVQLVGAVEHDTLRRGNGGEKMSR